MKTVVDDKDGEVSQGLERAADARPASWDGAVTTSPSSPSSPPSPSSAFSASFPSFSAARSAHIAFATGLSAFRAARAVWLVQPDAEALHDARVALRRLRTALAAYEALVRVPFRVKPASIRRLSRRLAPLRDVDVAIQELQLSGDLCEPELRDRLEQARERVRGDVGPTFHRRGARRWQRAMQRWLRAPAFTKSAMVDARGALSARIEQLWPPLDALSGWAIDASDLATAAAEALDELHRLRRRFRDARYLLELGSAAGLGEPHLSIAHFQQLQDGLGGLQDLRVLRDTLVREVGPDWAKAAPRLAQALSAAWSERWQQWVELRSTVGESGPRLPRLAGAQFSR